MSFGLIGGSIQHSLSPMIHKLLHDMPYPLYETLDLKGTLSLPTLKALNVTMPLKKAAFEMAHAHDDWAELTGAVNTLIKTPEGWHGYNTDASALYELFSKWFKNDSEKAVHILGNGATARTIRVVLSALGFQDITVHARHPKAGESTWESLRDASGILMNATPLGLHETANDYPFDLNRVTQFDAVFDVLYTPYRTPLIQAAIRHGIRWTSGLSMLIQQAIHGAKLAQPKIPLKADAQTVFKTVLKNDLNIVIIGMPQAGKSTFGNALARHLNRPFFDVDAIIKETTGKAPHTWIESSGEAAFRRIEHETVKKLESQRGVVIATGGGTVLDPENVARLKAKGVLVYLQAPDPVSLDASRPLSSTIDAYHILKKTRTPLYERVCDYAIHRHEDFEIMKEKWEVSHDTFLRHQWP